jgi:malate synthase
MTPSNSLARVDTEDHGFAVPSAAWTSQARRLLVPELQELLVRLHRELEGERRELLAARERRQERWNRGECPGYLPANELPEARGDWRTAPLPADLLRRRVEFPGPICDTKMVCMLSRSADGARVGIAYLRGWNDDRGWVAWDDLMEDLATLEISRARTWQWLRHRTVLDGGEPVTVELVRRVFAEEQTRIERELADAGAPAGEIEDFRRARFDAEAIFTESAFRPFLASASEPAGESDEIRRAQLRGDAATR